MHKLECEILKHVNTKALSRRFQYNGNKKLTQPAHTFEESYIIQ